MMQYTKRFCKEKLFGDSEIPLKIALVEGGLMVYVKEDKSQNDKYKLCFGIPEVQGMNEFWFSVSAATGSTNVFTYDVTELKIFSDLPNDDFTQFLRKDPDYKVQGRDVIRRGSAPS